MTSAALTHSLGPIASSLSAAELDQFAESLAQHGSRCVRPNPRRPLDQLPFETTSVPWSSLGRFLIDNSIRPGSFLNFAVGDYAVQDAASLLPIALMQLQPGHSVIDCCAAPGGKSAAVLEQLDGQGLLVSNEVIASRVDTLQLTLARTGYTNYMIAHQAVDRLAEVTGDEFDCVLVDAPCTGQSLVARGKQSLSAFSNKQVAHCAARQQTILQSAIEMVRPGGRLVYSTCTFAFAENEGIMHWLREQLPDWQPVILDQLSAWQTPGHAGCYRLWPHRDHCSGGFAAALVRPATSTHVPTHVPTHIDTKPTRAIRAHWQPAGQTQFLQDWCSVAEGTRLHQYKQKLCWFDPSLPESWHALAYCGIEVATQFGDHWQPAYPTAVLIDPATQSQSGVRSLPLTPHQSTQLTDQEAINYFTGTSLHRPGPASWQTVTWQSRPIAWAKQVAGQLKNHLPKPLRQNSLKQT